MEDKGARHALRIAAVSAFLKKRGFYVVLGLCALCVGIAALAAIKPRPKEEADLPPEVKSAAVSEDETLDEAAAPPLIEQVQAEETSAPVLAAEEKPEQAKPEAPKQQSKAAAPVKGKIIWGFAVKELLYSKTLEQWTTHEGVDLAAKLGEEVHVIKAGTVKSVYTDDGLGVTVKVEHGSGLVSVYANLQEEPKVKEGQRLEAGAVVGKVGESAVSECSLEPHLHFAIYKDDEPVNPAKYVLISS